MSHDQYRVFDPKNPPEWLDSEWWKDTPNCNHWDNPVHQARLTAAADAAMRYAGANGRIVDLGAGDGGLLAQLPDDVMAMGYEVITDSVRYANEVRGVDVTQLNVVQNLNQVQPGHVAVATEMLEHLADPYDFVRRLYEETEFEFFIASSPHSETRGHHEWNHAWVWDRTGYRALIESGGWAVVEQFDAEWSQIVVSRR